LIRDYDNLSLGHFQCFLNMREWYGSDKIIATFNCVVDRPPIIDVGRRLASFRVGRQVGRFRALDLSLWRCTPRPKTTDARPAGRSSA
jgi:hypothetical protein